MGINIAINLGEKIAIRTDGNKYSNKFRGENVAIN